MPFRSLAFTAAGSLRRYRPARGSRDIMPQVSKRQMAHPSDQGGPAGNGPRGPGAPPAGGREGRRGAAGAGRRRPVRRPGDRPHHREQLPGAEADRHRRHGARLPGRAAVAGQDGGPEAAAQRADGRREAHQALRAGGQERLAAEPPQLDPDHRLRARPRPAVHRDGAAARGGPGPADPARGPAAARAHRPDHGPGRSPRWTRRTPRASSTAT